MPKKVDLSVKTYNRLAKYATGFMTPDDVIEWLLDEHEGVEREGEGGSSVPKASDGRDLTKYEFQGMTFSKAKLVHAVVKQYVHSNPLITLGELQEVFPPELQAFSLPVVMEWNRAFEKYGHKTPKRFYLQDKMRIELSDCSIAVCTQWGVENIHNFINQATSLNFIIIPQGTTPKSDGENEMERQCRICGEWKSVEEQYSYPPKSKRHYWCQDCFDIYIAKRADNEDPKPWIRSMQEEWDYVSRKVNPDRPLTGLRGGKSRTTQKGYINKNNQQNQGTTGESGTDHNSISYTLQCLDCEHIYAANGTDIFQRKCPNCQGGAPGL